MSVTGLCQICERAVVAYQCSRCGTMVCEQHYVRDAGLCTDCVGS